MAQGNDEAEGKAGDRKHNWGVTLVSLVVGAAFGVAGTVAAAAITNKYTVDQFWREQRLTAYTSYLDTLQQLEAMEEKADSRIRTFGPQVFNHTELYCKRPSTADHLLVAQDNERLETLSAELKAKKSKVDAFSLDATLKVTSEIEADRAHAAIERALNGFTLRQVCEKNAGHVSLGRTSVPRGTRHFIQAMREELGIAPK